MSHKTAISREGGRHSRQLSQMRLFENDLPGTSAPRKTTTPPTREAGNDH